MADRIILTQISSRAWEHPADRAALNTLRSLPGFDEVVRKVAGFIGERGVRHLFTANAVRVGPRQRPKLDDLYSEVVATLDWPKRPQLYITQTPLVNAWAVGFDDPFIVLSSEMLRILDREEQRYILAHELAHIMSGHTTYRTIAIIILFFGMRNLPILAGMALLPFQLALLEWYRKSELSSDRGALLGTQDQTTAMRTFLKLAGGERYDDEIDLDEFMAQAAEYEVDESTWDSVLKILNTAFRDHPFHTLRAAELQRWVQRGEYTEILSGNYQRRDTSDGDRPLTDDYADAAGYYGQQAKQAWSTLEDTLKRAGDAFGDAIRGTKK